MTGDKAPRFWGFTFGDNEVDNVVLAIFNQYKERNEDFSAYVKRLIYEDQMGKGSNLDDIERKIDRIAQMIERGKLHYQADPDDPQGEDDQDLLDSLNGVSV